MDDRDVWLESAAAGAGGGLLETLQPEHRATNNPVAGFNFENSLTL